MWGHKGCMTLLGSIVKPLVLDGVVISSDLFYLLSLYFKVKISYFRENNVLVEPKSYVLALNEVQER